MDKTTSTCLILMAIAFATSCKPKEQKNKIPPLQVQVAESQAISLSETIWFATATEAQYNVTIEPRVSSYLQGIRYNSGEPVSMGDTIFEIDPSQLNTTYYAAQAAFESAQASLVEAENNYNRAIPLAQIDAISKTSLDEYTANFAAAKANVKSSEEALKSAELNLSYAVINAPISGLIAESPASLGDLVGPDTKYTSLTTISYIDTLVLPLAVPTVKYLKQTSDRQSSYDNRDLLSQITLILADSSEYDHKAIYDYTKKDISGGNSTVVIYVKVANPNAKLKPNMFTRVRANIGAAESRVMVPQRAVTQLQGVNSVWVIDSDSSAHFRVVTLGGTYGDDWHITSGLNAGERVATSAQLKLHEGAKVAPVMSQHK